MSRGAAPAALLGVCALAAAGPAAAGEPAKPAPARRGPLEMRDEWLLAQSRLTLPALAPDPLGAGKTRVSVDLAWGSDFGWRRGTPRDTTAYLVDGEHRTLSLDVRRGLTPAFTVGLRLPVRWRGGGIMDGIVDWFHGLTGLPGGGRPLFPADQLRVEWTDPVRGYVRWDADPGTGLGNAEVLGHWAFRRAEVRAWTAALAVRATLPTATGAFAPGGAEAGAQLVSAWPLHRRVDLYAGAGGTAHSRRVADGIEYAPARGHGFVALEWRPHARWSLVAEVDASTRLVENLPGYPGGQGYFRMGASVDVSERWRLHGGFVEGIKNQHATTDFGIVAGVSRTF
ncbi:MAG TPA: DUF3187 family protein [Vicinamibacteria bacterium]|nr:DUF3187 family protein [Vicinamibacteria bacterium]